MNTGSIKYYFLIAVFGTLNILATKISDALFYFKSFFTILSQFQVNIQNENQKSFVRKTFS